MTGKWVKEELKKCGWEGFTEKECESLVPMLLSAKKLDTEFSQINNQKGLLFTKFDGLNFPECDWETQYLVYDAEDNNPIFHIAHVAEIDNSGTKEWWNDGMPVRGVTAFIILDKNFQFLISDDLNKI